MKHSFKFTAKPQLIGGVLVFFASLGIYILTLSPTLNFWDCGEFIACANKLEIGHAPEAPLYLMFARLFSAWSAPSQVAQHINLLSALCSAFTIYLLYASSIIILNKIFTPKNSRKIIFSAIISSLAFAFTDTFWFSAVEAEVYALSMLFTAFTLWAILRWEQELTEKKSHRWLLLIAFTMGLSVGVHLLNLLTIPVVTYWVFIHLSHSKFKHIYGLFIGIIILLGVHFFFIQNGLIWAGKLELLFVNSFHFPPHTGLLLFLSLWFASLTVGIYITRYQHAVSHFILVALFLFTLGTSSYAMIIIRANASTAINLNDPSQVFSLESYINRKQYGERPLIKGPWYGSHSKDIQPTLNYRLDKNQKYESFEEDNKSIYDPKDLQYLQRMYSSQNHHINGYYFWSGLEQGQKPTFFHQLTYLFKYQLGHMYFRYFLWNFSGRQNHYQGHGDFLNGNFITGIPFIDQQFVGSRQSLHSKETSSPSHHNYFMIPLLLGMIGFLVLIRKRHPDLLYLLVSLFVLTGVAIAFYLNQPPFEPRERDYVFTGSFYSFAIFIGIGTMALLQKIKQFSPSKLTDIIAYLALTLALPGLLLANNYNDHNRSDRTLARDLAASYLESCQSNAILFTYGDNDTYPLWYLQEVEGIRKDIRVINLGLLSADWYIHQQNLKQKNKQGIHFTIPLERYKKGDMDYAAVMDQPSDITTITKGLEHLADSTGRMPSSSIYMVARNIQLTDQSPRLLSLNKNYLMKGEIALLDIIASNYPQRPIYFTNGTPSDAMLGLKHLTQPYGLVSKLVLDSSTIDADQRYTLFKTKIHISTPEHSWWDETCINTIHLSRLQHNTIELANQLIAQNDLTKAQEVLLKFVPITHLPNFESSSEDAAWIKTLFSAQLNHEAITYLEKTVYTTIQNFHFYIYSQAKLGDNMLLYAKEEYDYLTELYAIANEHRISEIKHAIEPYLNTF